LLNTSLNASSAKNPNSLPPQAHRLGRSLGAMFILRLLSQILTFVILIILAQRLGPATYGQYSFIFGYLVFFTLLISFGINEITLREIARDPKARDELLRSALWIKGALTLCAIALALAGLGLIHLTSEIRIWAMIASLTLLTSFAFHSYRTVFEIPFQIDYRMGEPSLVFLLSRGIFLLLLLLWMGRGISLSLAIAVQLISEGAGLAILLGMARRHHYPLLPRFNGRRIKQILGQSWPIALAGAFVMIYTKIDILLLQAMRGSVEVGYYAVSMRLVDALAIVPTVFAAAALPLFSHAFTRDIRGYRRYVGLSFRALLYVILPITVITALYAGDIIRLFYGPAYAPSAGALRILIWAEIFVYGGIAFDAALVASGRQMVGTFLAAGMALCNVLVNIWAIPRYGIVGAAMATAVSYALGLIVAPGVVRIRDLGGLFWREVPLPLFICLASGLTAKWLHLPLWAACCWQVAGLALGLWMTGQLRPDLLMLLRTFWRKETDENSAR